MTEQLKPHLETFEFLLRHDEFEALRTLLHSLLKQLPQDDPRITDFAAMMLHRALFFEEACHWSAKTLQFVPDHPQVKFNHAQCLKFAGRLREAEAILHLILQSVPDSIDTLIDLSDTICLQGRYDEAYRMLQEIRVRFPGHASLNKVRYYESWHLLHQGRFREGMDLQLVSRELAPWGTDFEKIEKPKWTGTEDLRGKKLLVIGEGGAGDEIIQFRFVRELKELGATVLWDSANGMGSLFRRSDPSLKVSDRQRPATTEYDYWVSSISLAVVLQIELKDLNHGAYLQADPMRVEQWKKRLGDGFPKVGLRWRGAFKSDRRLRRGFSFSEMQPLMSANSQAKFFSLQKDFGLEELPANSGVVDLSAELSDWEETAAAIAAMDLVITSCTSIAHLSGALGKPTWVCIPLWEYYIWATPLEKSPWYPDVRLFRQTQAGRWNDVMLLVAQSLSRL